MTRSLLNRVCSGVLVCGLLPACGGAAQRLPDEASGGGDSASGGHSTGAASKGGTSGAGASAGGVSAGGVSAGGVSAGAGGASQAVELLMPTITAFCAAARSCCQSQGEPAMLDACEAMFADNNATFGSLASGNATVDARALAACQAAYEAAATSCEQNPVLTACRGVVVGTRAEGASCTSGSECSRDPGPNTCLITEQGGSVGTCQKMRHAESGEPCSVTCRAGEDCTFTTYGAADSLLALCFESEGVYCDYSNSPSTCRPLLALGATCASDDECGSLAYCEQTCKPRRREGEACDRCLSSLTCRDGKCQSPPFASAATCEGRSLGPY